MLRDMKHFSLELLSEIENKMQASRESFENDELDEGEQPLTALEAFRDIAEEIDQRDERSKGPYRYSTGVRREVMICLIEYGCYKPIAETAVKEMIRDGVGVRARDFPKFAGKRYEWVSWLPLTGQE